MYVKRLLSYTLKKAINQFPAVLVSGPRQAGKTTFLKNELSDQFRYISFDDPVERSFAQTDPNGFLKNLNNFPVILDEIQYVPNLLQSIKLDIENRPDCNGRWLITGSQQLQMLQRASETLAGKIAFLELYPLGIREIDNWDSKPLENIIWEGGYPDLTLQPEKRELWLRSYMQSYVERYVRQLQNIRDLRPFEQFVAMACARHGKEFNSARFSRETGISLPTAKTWANILEASYLAYFLPPYFDSMGKRTIKSPKLYMADPAIACYLTRQPSSSAAISGSMSQVLFEGLVVMETVKAFTNRGMKPAAWYWRSHDGLEINLLIQLQGKLIPIEIKPTATPTATNLEALVRFRRLAGNERCEPGLLVCCIDGQEQLSYGVTAISWRDFPEWLGGLLN